jgi:membrane protease YdiL (CAAX protease family)
MEEVLFRGLIHTSFARHYGPRLAVFLTAVLFAAPHVGFGWIASVELFLLGIVFSWYRHRYGRLDLPIAAHSFHNLLYCLTIVVRI